VVVIVKKDEHGAMVPQATTPLKDGDEALERLIREGVLTRGRGCARKILERPPMKLPFSLLETLLEERGA